MAYSTKTFTWTYAGTICSYGFGDFNRDGVIEFIYGGPTTPFNGVTQPFQMISINSSGVITDASSIFASVPYAIHGGKGIVADFNGDGRLDFFSGNSGYDAAPWDGEPDTLLLSGPDGRLHDASATLPQGLRFKMTHTAAAGDIDNDGDLDILSGVIGRPYLLINDGHGQFTQSYDRMPADLGAEKDPEHMILKSRFVDLNGDGYLDLATGFSESSPVAGMVYFNDGHGYFAAETEAALPVGLYGAKNTIVNDILDLDLNGDGHKDLILAETAGNPYYQGQKLQILINDGTGHFRDETAQRITQDGKGLWNQQIVAVDVNGDGHLDIVATSDYGDAETQNTVWLNNGSGSFTPVPKEKFAGFEGGVVAVDLNHDEQMDFLSFRKEGDYFSGGTKWEFKTHIWEPDPPPHQRIVGSDDADDIHGWDGNDTIFGGRGNDWLYGDNGNDRLYGGYDNDRLDGGSGADYLYGETGNDRLYGRADNDVLNGSSGNDYLYGDAGDDRLYGGLDSDVMYGGSGKDVFVFNTKPNKLTNVDSIRDFNPVYDTIWLENSYFRVGSGTASKPLKMSPKMFWANNTGKAHDADDRIIYDKDSGILYYDQDGTGAKYGSVKIATISKKLKMSYHDFYVI